MRVRTVAMLVVAVLVATLTTTSTAVSAHEQAQPATRVMPGSFTGYAFDTCDAPSQRKMDDWRRHSKFWGVGIYITGMNRACQTQRHLTRGWVARQSRLGWRLLPIVVGRQASCSPKGYYKGKRISDDPAHRYAKARAQGKRAARGGVDAARRLGIARHSVLWFDLESFDITRRRCRGSALAFVSGWTNGLHRLRYRSGLYSSASTGIRMVDNARRRAPGRHALPDYLWVAEWNGRATVRSSYISQQGWWPHRRVHQYRGPHDERHGGSRINIDSDFMSTGRGTRPGRPAPHCQVRVDFASYPRLRRGDAGDKVRAAQCFLRQKGRYAGRRHGRFDKATGLAVRRFQKARRLSTTGVLNARTWTALLSLGPAPLLKFGSGGNAVRRLQRSLNAAADSGLAVDGVFGRAEMKAVRRYQRQAGRKPTGVVTGTMWRMLRKGRVVAR